ncbi:Protein of unknown function [Pyronema omphalodes CBS 100304]|uniref:Uncharacterized protein n=1 Tax=Pyronema omphalodes (strain CBS 100304) TaxID=1076935 RepID=U4LP11_PYROM|nr:Protein of unknown function [Pyronema omphalodes CBS 100304]
MAKCEFYATLYAESLLKSSDATHTLLASLPELLPEFYCSIIGYFSPTSVIQRTKNTLLPFATFLEPHIRSVFDKEQLVKEAASLGNMERIRGQSIVLDRLDDLVSELH